MSNLTTLADRLKAKLDGAKDQNLVVADQDLVELMDSHLDMVSAAHISGHLSGHASGGRQVEAQAE